ncbi:anti-sigma K factor RskA [Haloferula helveola]|uniref:Anti-sigma K factor RskA n=1 Tax=Haloferula helveola TaxID=490095 RepID=A0ABM7R9C9_9BACT|nr:anti-sigma K factor RskA [Haloferula helveola]
MNPDSQEDRFAELSAGLALGDLDAAETRELEELCEKLGRTPDGSLMMTAAALDVALGESEEMPPELADRLWDLAGEKEAPGGATIVEPAVSPWHRIVRHPASGWAIAAVLVLLLALQGMRGGNGSAQRLTADRLVAESSDLLRLGFSGLGEFEAAGGEVLWSDDRQQGFMRLTGIPVNDPTVAQYQLWIVDPQRDADSPVDGGVFDIDARSHEVLIPIDAKLPINEPKAFVITLEQPGGVVKSKQETVVALAKL